MPIAFLLEEFCTYSRFIKGHSQQTIKRYQENISYFCKYTEIRNTNEISRSNVLSFFLYGRSQRNWRARTYRTYYMSLLVFFRWCKNEGHLEINFVEGIELPKLEKSKKRGLSQQEATKLLEFVYNYPYELEFQRLRNHAIFATFIFTGLRRNELLNLKLTDIELDNRTIFVRMGKGGKDRMIPINTTLASILHRYFAVRMNGRKTCPEFFTSSKGNTGLTRHGLKHIIDQMKEASGIHFSSHLLRHTFARFMLEGGCDIYTLKELMGHSDIRVTAEYMFADAIQMRKEMTKHPLSSSHNQLKPTY